MDIKEQVKQIISKAKELLKNPNNIIYLKEDGTVVTESELRKNFIAVKIASASEEAERLLSEIGLDLSMVAGTTSNKPESTAPVPRRTLKQKLEIMKEYYDLKEKGELKSDKAFYTDKGFSNATFQKYKELYEIENKK